MIEVREPLCNEQNRMEVQLIMVLLYFIALCWQIYGD